MFGSPTVHVQCELHLKRNVHRAATQYGISDSERDRLLSDLFGFENLQDPLGGRHRHAGSFQNFAMRTLV